MTQVSAGGVVRKRRRRSWAGGKLALSRAGVAIERRGCGAAESLELLRRWPHLCGFQRLSLKGSGCLVFFVLKENGGLVLSCGESFLKSGLPLLLGRGVNM